MTSSPVDLISLGLSPEHAYKHAIQYCSSYTTHLSYQDKCTLVALHRQTNSHTSECSSLFAVDEEDWVREWDKVKDLTPVEAMTQFSALLSNKSDQFSLWMSDLYAGSKSTTQQLLNSSPPLRRPTDIGLSSYRPPSHVQIVPSPAAAYKSSRTIEDVLEAARERSDLTPEVEDRYVEAAGILPGHLWCKRSEASEFILAMREEPEARILISPGESITIKVPVNPDVKTLFWEFVTERCDIGFGAELELSTDTPEQPELTEIIPKERILCCEDVIVGCHRATSASELKGQRTYYLRFDNKYSLLTSKVLFYKVYCRSPVINQISNSV